MKNLLIVGARGFGRETYGFRHSFIGYGEEFTIKGFLDSASDALDGFEGFPPIVSSVEDYEIQPDDVFVVALGDPKMKKKYIEMIQQKGGQFISLLSKDVLMSGNAKKIGEGSIIYGLAALSGNATIGNFVTILSGSIVGHDAVVDDFCMLDCQSFMGGFSRLQKGASLGTGAMVMPHVTVGEYAVVNAGSVVAKDVEAGSTVMGMPAQNSRRWLRMVLQGVR
ncbi:MAG: acetyltransferase [Prevotella sp.]|nr:acetyltransferase [Prevotella sp.]